MSENTGKNLPMAQPSGCACCSPASSETATTPTGENTMNTQTFPVTGMTCGHCVNAVTSEVKALPGVSDVNVRLVPDGPSTVTVTSTEPLSDEQVSAALDEAGDYHLARS
ncbi:heavy-metal-associated domain-containing protein [Knoellia aerolata]|nr:heavy-metal-associated domain-containing protein [Knoellia aerolata]